MNSLQKIWGAIILSTPLLTGCGEKPIDSTSNHIRITNEVCTRSMNLVSTDPENPNHHNFHWKGIITPVIRECSSDIEGDIHLNTKSQFSRAEHFNTNPTPWEVIKKWNTTNIVQPIKNLLDTVTPRSSISDWVKPYTVLEHKPRVNLKWTIIGHASAEGFTEQWNSELWNGKSKPINTTIAIKRAEQLENNITKEFSKQWIWVTSNDIQKKGIVEEFTDSERWELTVMWERRFPRQADILIKLLADFNAGKIPQNDPVWIRLNTILSEKRFAEANISITWNGIGTTIEADTLINSGVWWMIAGVGFLWFARKNKKPLRW